MFKKVALILTAVTSLAIANANAGTALVTSSNGYWAVAGKDIWSTDQAVGKATRLCQKMGGVDIKVVATINSHPIPGNGAIAESGHGPGAIVGYSLGCASDEEALHAAYAMCRDKGGANPHVIPTE